MRVLFIGSVSFSVPLLKIVRSFPDVNLVGVVTKQSSTFNSDFVDLSKEFHSDSPPIFYFKNNNPELAEWIKSKKVDVIFCLGWSHLLPGEVLRTPTFGTIGYHPASLPQNRGRHPIIWALALGLPKTSSTFFLISEGADEGDILTQKDVPIKESDYAQDLYDRLQSTAEDQLKHLIQDLLSNNIKFKSQANMPSNYWRKRSDADGKIDWRMPAKGIYNLIRALAPPYNGAYFEFNKEVFIIKKSEFLPGEDKSNHIPGEILHISGDSIDIKAGEGIIRITSPELRKIVKQGDFL